MCWMCGEPGLRIERGERDLACGLGVRDVLMNLDGEAARLRRC